MPDDEVLPFDLAGCLDRVRQRNQAAARELVEHLYPLVIRIVRSHLPRRVAEEDLAQDEASPRIAEHIEAAGKATGPGRPVRTQWHEQKCS